MSILMPGRDEPVVITLEPACISALRIAISAYASGNPEAATYFQTTLRLQAPVKEPILPADWSRSFLFTARELDTFFRLDREKPIYRLERIDLQAGTCALRLDPVWTAWWDDFRETIGAACERWLAAYRRERYANERTGLPVLFHALRR